MQKQITHLKLSEGNYQGEVTGPEPIRHGMGQMNFTDGSFYEGQWMNDKRNGQGIFYFSSGNVYQGYFVNNKKEGYGEFYYARSEEYYKGYWMNDKKHGQGEYFFRNGDKFEGFFVQDIKHGPGVKTSKNMRYEGVWENNLKNGSFEFINLKTGKQGVIYYRNNKKVGIQSVRTQNPGDYEAVGYGPRAGERMNHEKQAFSNYTHSYESLSGIHKSSNQHSLSDVKGKPADYPVEVGRLDEPKMMMNSEDLSQILHHNTPRHLMEANQLNNGREMGNLLENDQKEINQGESEHLVQNSNVGSIEIDMNGIRDKNSISLNRENTQNTQKIVMKQQQQKQQMNLNKKETNSFKSYGSRTFKSNSQGTFNSSAKTTMKAFYDYKEFKEGLSSGQVNMKLMRDVEIGKPNYDLPLSLIHI